MVPTDHLINKKEHVSLVDSLGRSFQFGHYLGNTAWPDDLISRPGGGGQEVLHPNRLTGYRSFGVIVILCILSNLFPGEHGTIQDGRLNGCASVFNT